MSKKATKQSRKTARRKARQEMRAAESFVYKRRVNYVTLGYPVSLEKITEFMNSEMEHPAVGLLSQVSSFQRSIAGPLGIKIDHGGRKR